ncbi:unnamed protein product [Heligmosomoides polygyrus]|uniref:Transposase n=1 Tax=Heligmosomoides polygyrus TaxID=6339 RepID=A0A183FL42_HELPZ|nr:unnamed protein product [Heligmosomoides polygyrus]
METKMLRWTAGITRLDRVPNDATRQRFGVVPIADKLREARLRWYGHVLRANDDSVCKIGLNLEVPGKRPGGRPKQYCLDTLHLDLKIAGVHPDQALDREKWLHHTRRADLATKPPSGINATKNNDKGFSRLNDALSGARFIND